MPSQKHVERKKKQREKKKKLLRRQEHAHLRVSQPDDGTMRDIFTGKEIRGLRKMSEILNEFVEPFLDDVTDKRTFDALISFAVFVWNASLLSEREIMLRRNEYLAKMPANLVEVFGDRFDFLLARKALLFSSDKRFIVSFRSEWDRYGPYLQVASSPQPGTYSLE